MRERQLRGSAVYRVNERAKSLIEGGVREYEKFSGKDHMRNVWAMDYLAELYIDTKEYDKAQSILEKNLKIYEKEFGHDHSLTKRACFLSYYSYIYKKHILYCACLLNMRKTY